MQTIKDVSDYDDGNTDAAGEHDLSVDHDIIGYLKCYYSYCFIEFLFLSKGRTNAVI